MKIAIIPIRKGSKRFPNKNIKLINGKTLYERAIETVMSTKLFDKVIISTNDLDIIKSLESDKRLYVDFRSEKLSNDSTTLIEVIRSIIIKRNLSLDDTICLTTVTNPQTKPEDIIGGLRLFEKEKNTTISVCEVDYPIELTWKFSNESKLYWSTDISSTRKQDFTKSFRWNDSFIIDSAKSFMDLKRNNFGYNPSPYIMPQERSIVIDYSWQFELISNMIKNKENEKSN